MAKIPVAEIFGPTLQGEGSLAGLRTHFLRLAYCDGAGANGWCSWCDSMFAVDPKNKSQWEYLTEQEIADRLQSLGSHVAHLTISGGNPAIHDLTNLIRLLRKEYMINVETQGTIWRDWLLRADTVTVSPKPPSSGSICDRSKLENVLSQLKSSTTTIKVVVNPDYPEDYEFACDILRVNGKFTEGLYMSVYTSPQDTTQDIIERWLRLAERVRQDKHLCDVAVLPQLHVLLWGHKRGV